MKELQTPQQARPSDYANRRSKDSSSKKVQKIPKKSLNAAFASVSEDVSETSKDSVDFSPISDANHSGESAESFLTEVNSALSASSETLFPLDLTPSSKFTSETDKTGHLSLIHYKTSEFDGSKIGSLEADIVVNFLKTARTQVLNSANTDAQSKKLLDAMIMIIIDEFYALPEERGHIKTRIIFLCFLLWIIVVAAAFYFSSGVQNSFSGPFPT